MWQHCNLSEIIPTENLVWAGIDADGSKIFAGRAFHEGDLIPAKVIPRKSATYVCYGGKEILKEDFEVMYSGSFIWESATGGNVPERAVKAGWTKEGKSLYMGRAFYKGAQTPGKVQPSHRCLYIPFDGKEIAIQEYEVLCTKHE